jgi:hypothetical protein
MNTQDINASIAEACGWVYCDGWHHPDGRSELPDYTTDLNAMHEAEKTLNGVQQFAYMGELSRLDTYCTWSSMTATAGQRAEAFLRALKKWEE